ncbi:MAG: threonine synthase [archaeon]
MGKAFLRAIGNGKTYPIDEKRYESDSGELLEVAYEFGSMDTKALKEKFAQRGSSQNPLDKSGVWRFRELIPFMRSEANVVSLSEGNTPLYAAPKSASYAGVKKLSFKHQGMNPTGSFKDNGMTAAVSKAKEFGSKTVVCASTGNTSASMAAYASRAGMTALVIIPSGQIAMGKLAQALDYGAKTIQIDGDFDDAMRIVRELAEEKSVYILNSINPFRLEGQKTIMIEMLCQRNWEVPDRVVVPGGNLGNSSSFGKAFKELRELGFIETIPKITIVQAEGAAPLYNMWKNKSKELKPVKAHTLATAIKIGNPVSWQKAMRALEETKGSVAVVSEKEIADAKAIIGKDGIGCEPASATTLAAIKNLAGNGIDEDEDIVAILTGNALKDPQYTVDYHSDSLFEEFEGKKKIPAAFANKPIKLPADTAKIKKELKL